MSDRKSGNSSISNTTIAVGVAAATALGGLLYLLFNKEDEQVNRPSEGRGRPSPPHPPQPPTRTIQETRINRPIPILDSPCTSVNTGSRDNIDMCCICYEPLFTDDESSIPVEIPCNHYFHMACIRKWLKEVRTCPLCDSQIPNDLKSIFF